MEICGRDCRQRNVFFLINRKEGRGKYGILEKYKSIFPNRKERPQESIFSKKNVAQQQTTTQQFST
jgi:hypothetical protein